MAREDEKKGKDMDFVITNQLAYYLSPFDSPGTLVTTIKFDGKNYDNWEQLVRIVLKAKNKLGFIDRKITKPKVNEGEVSVGGNA